MEKATNNLIEDMNETIREDPSDPCHPYALQGELFIMCGLAAVGAEPVNALGG